MQGVRLAAQGLTAKKRREAQRSTRSSKARRYANKAVQDLTAKGTSGAGGGGVISGQPAGLFTSGDSFPVYRLS